MRFRSWPKPTAYEETSRKRAAFLTRQRRDREKLPLFADMIAAGQHSVDEEMARRAIWWPQQQQRMRDERAEVWRRARGRLFAFDAPERRTIRAAWRDCPYPADPCSFADFLHQIEVGRLDPVRPPWKYHARVQARTTPDPQSFDEAFRRVGQRMIEPAPGMPKVEARQYCGNLGKGILFLLSRIVPPAERRDFEVPGLCTGLADRVPSGPHLDIEVRGVCSDADIALIRRLAEARESVPAIVRRIDRFTGVNGKDVTLEPHRLLILSCSATKRDDPGWIPAIERYDGPLWQTVRAVDPDRQRIKVAVLSARYGFLDARAPVENYDTRLTADLAGRMIAGGMTTRWPRPPSPRKPDTYGDSPGCQIASLSNHGTRPFTDVALAGGRLYLDVMRGFVEGFRELRCVAPDARITEINAGIGFMRQQIRAWLEETPA